MDKHSHGGYTVSQYLRQELHGLFESSNKLQIPEMYAWAREIGGYFKRFDGGVLKPWIHPSAHHEGEMDLTARATLIFLQAGVSLSYC